MDYLEQSGKSTLVKEQTFILRGLRMRSSGASEKDKPCSSISPKEKAAGKVKHHPYLFFEQLLVLKDFDRNEPNGQISTRGVPSHFHVWFEVGDLGHEVGGRLGGGPVEGSCD